MPGLVPGIHVLLAFALKKTWMVGTTLAPMVARPAMTPEKFWPAHYEPMSKKSENIMKRTATELRHMHKRGEIKSDWKAAAEKAVPSGRDPDDAMEEIDWLTTELPQPRSNGR